MYVARGGQTIEDGVRIGPTTTHREDHVASSALRNTENTVFMLTTASVTAKLAEIKCLDGHVENPPKSC